MFMFSISFYEGLLIYETIFTSLIHDESKGKIFQHNPIISLQIKILLNFQFSRNPTVLYSTFFNIKYMKWLFIKFPK